MGHRASVAGIVLAVLALVCFPAGAETMSSGLDVPRTGLPPLFGALQAVANCPGLEIDARRFQRALAVYGLSGEDLTPIGRFPDDIADLTDQYRTRLLDDRPAFCSAARLQFRVKYGILRDAVQ